MEHRAHLGVECPQCHGKQFVEVQFDQPLELSPLALEIRAQLEAWMASRCPDHPNAISQVSKN
jgi:hypothetical protein